MAGALGDAGAAVEALFTSDPFVLALRTTPCRRVPSLVHFRENLYEEITRLAETRLAQNN